ncbi:MAG TPA: A/G-specific adenine glycosylase [Acidimicrobiales bacterium]|nr:A/G-specific adenine glycosylase [Acidimicrobiales bacterium]
MRSALLEWSAANRRDLPWRRTRDPWAVVVSELMLQQTQVARVVPRYAAFLARFPTPADCAAAPVGEVVRAWAGLGYNRRAVNLHRMAMAVVEHHAGRLPLRLEELVALPGVGAYTARAVLAFANEEDVGVVDVNAARVLARTAGRRLGAREVQDRADALVPAGEGWAWNQAVLDLGATICTKRAPRCGACPVAASCGWHRSGGDDPAVGSAGTGGAQSAFAGSDRQGRGRLVDALRRGPVPWTAVAAAAGWPGDEARARAVAASLVVDGLAEDAGGGLRLPGSPECATEQGQLGR